MVEVHPLVFGEVPLLDHVIDFLCVGEDDIDSLDGISVVEDVFKNEKSHLVGFLKAVVETG